MIASRIPITLLATVAFSAAAADTRPLHWGEQATHYATVCEKRWHVVRIKDLRNRGLDAGDGALDQAKREKEAHFAGRARCFTGDVTFRPVDHADVIDDTRTWVLVATPVRSVWAAASMAAP